MTDFATVAGLDLRRRALARLAALPDATVTAAYLGALLTLSTVLRTRVLDGSFWIDEGLSVGIASRPLTEIPLVLKQDGSPPLYYLLLHAWMGIAGRSETATHLLSVIFALAVVPAAYWLGRSLFSRRVAFILAALAAVNPFLTAYAQETRMYTLVALLSVLATGVFVHAFVHGRRRYLPVFSVLLALLLYTHNWGLFFGLGAAAALAFLAVYEVAAPQRLIRDAVLAFGGTALLYAAWLPTLLFQAQHTGAPWSRTPSPAGLFNAPTALTSGDGAAIALLLGGGTGLAVVLRRVGTTERRAVLTMIVLASATLVFAWLSSQIAPAWANRYLAVVIGPVLALAAVGVARAGRLGAVALTLVFVLWLPYQPTDSKSNVEEITSLVAPMLDPGDLVVATHPEQVPALHYYLPDGFRYATTLGPVRDPRLMDWRDAVDRLTAADPKRTLDRVVSGLPVGARVLLVRPLVQDEQGWLAPWTSIVLERSAQWGQLFSTDPRFKRVALVQSSQVTFKAVWAVVYERMPRA